MSNWLVDTHCHLDLFKDITSRFGQEDSLPIKTIAVTNAPSFYEHNCNLFKSAHNVRIALGLHPELIGNYGHEIGLFRKLLPTIRYVGEIGLDGSKQHQGTFQKQVEVFNEIVKCIAEQGNKIVTVHSRNAAQQTIEALSKIPRDKNCKIILHWYTGEVECVASAIRAGFYFSINHKMVATKKGKEIISAIPVSRLLTETDAPFTFVRDEDRAQILNDTIASLGAILGLPPTDVAQKVFDNFRQLLSE